MFLHSDIEDSDQTGGGGSYAFIFRLMSVLGQPHLLDELYVLSSLP